MEFSWFSKKAKRAPRVWSMIDATQALELRTFPAATVTMVIQAATQGIGETGRAYGEAVSSATPLLTRGSQLISQGYQQNSLDLGQAARAGDNSGIQRELQQNQQLAQLSSDVTRGYGEYVRAVSAAYSATVNAYINSYIDALLGRITPDVALGRIQSLPDSVSPNIPAEVATRSQASSELEQSILAKLTEFNNGGTTPSPGGSTINISSDTRVNDTSTLDSPIAGGDISNVTQVKLTGFVGQRFSETTAGRDVNDVYTFSVSRARQVSLRLEALNDPIQIVVEDVSRNELVSAVSTLTSDGLISRLLPAGTYRLRVTDSVPDVFAAGRTQTYRVTVNFS